MASKVQEQPTQAQKKTLDTKSEGETETKKLKTGPAVTSSGSVGGVEWPLNPNFVLQLVKMRVESLPTQSGKVFVAKRDDKVLDVFKGLVRQNILSVPVLTKAENRYYGYLDLADIIQYVVSNFSTINLYENWDSFWDVLEKEDILKSKTVKELMRYPLSSRNPFHPVKVGFSLFTGVELLAKEENLHRIPIIDNTRHLFTVLTQSQVVTFLKSNLNLIGERRNKPVGRMFNVIKNVLSVSEDSKTLDAFQLIIKEDITGVAVTNNEGVLIGNISLRDLKSISNNIALFWHLYQPVRTFLDGLGKMHNRPPSIVCCKQTDTLEFVINTLEQYKIHRVYVVDDSMKPIGIVSLKEVLSEVITV